MNKSLGSGESQQIFSSFTKIFKRRRIILVASVLGVLAPIVIYNQITPPLYQASASLVFEEVTSPVPDEVYNKTSTQQYLSNRLEEITSLAFARDIAVSLPQDMRARFALPNTPAPGFNRMVFITSVIQKSIAAFPLHTSNLFRIQVQLNDPKLCFAVANASVRILQEREYRIHLRGVVELRNFIDKQLQAFGTQLEGSESNLKTFKEKNKITSLDSESEEMLHRMTEAEVLYNSTQADRGATEKKLVAVNSTLAGQRRDLVPALTNIASPSAQKLKDKLVDLQAQYAQLIVQAYPQDHPQMVGLQRELEQTKKALADEAVKVSKEGIVGDPIAQIDQYLNQSVALQIDVESLKAREDALKRSVEGYRGYLGRLPAKEFDLARLTRERDVNQKIYMALLEKREEVRIAEAQEIPNSRVVDRPQFPTSPIKPRKGLNLAAGTFIGLILGMGIGLIIETNTRELDSTLEFERETGWSVLALVPRVKTAWAWLRLPWKPRSSESYVTTALVSHLNPQSAPGESYLMLRTRLEILGVGTTHRVVLVTSSGAGDGKSTTVANLAAAFAAAGRRTVVVDAELRRPVMHQIFGIPKAPGLSDVLIARNGGHKVEKTAAPSDGAPAAQPKIPDDPARQAIVPGVMVLASGRRPENARWEMSRSGMRRLLDDLKAKYDLVLVDAASPALVHDALMLCGLADAVIVVIDSSSYEIERVKEIRRLLEPSGANVMGAVVTKVDPDSRYGQYYGEYYSYDS